LSLQATHFLLAPHKG